MFANYSSPATGAAVESVFRNDSTNHTVSIHTSTQGSQGSKISLHKAALLAALTMTNDVNQTAEEFGSTKHTGSGEASMQMISFLSQQRIHRGLGFGCSIHGISKGIRKYIFLKSSGGRTDVPTWFLPQIPCLCSRPIFKHTWPD